MKLSLNKKLIVLALILIPFCSFASATLSTGGNYYIDAAHILSPTFERYLNYQLMALDETDGTQIIVVTTPTLEGASIEDYSMRIAEALKVGDEKNDNGVVLLVAPNEHKVRIEVGLGLEEHLTDILCNHIIKEEILPHFRNGDYENGIVAGINKIIEVVEGKFTQEDIPSSKGWIGVIGSVFGFIILIIILSSLGGGGFFPFILFMGGGRGGFGSGGGGFGGFSGGGGSFGGGGASGSW